MKQRWFIILICFLSTHIGYAQHWWYEIDSDSTKGSFIDTRDSSIYKWVRIGPQIWMAENLNYPVSIGSWCYDQNISNCAVYGRLYDWKTSTNICPKEWHLPTSYEWAILVNILGGQSVSGGKLKEIGREHWYRTNKKSTDQYGFAGLPGGYTAAGGRFSEITLKGYFWTLSEEQIIMACAYYLSYGTDNLNYDIFEKRYGFSVRCIKDEY